MRGWIVRSVALLVLVAVAALAWAPLAGYTTVQLTDLGSGRQIACRVLRDGERVVVTWRNSLFGQMVTEVLVARRGNLILTALSFADPRTGRPAPTVASRDVDDLYHTGGSFRVEGLAKPLGHVVFLVGEIGDPHVQVGDLVVRLKQEVGFGGRVLLMARCARLFEVVCAYVCQPRAYVCQPRAGSGGLR